MLFHSPDYILFLILAVAGFWLLARHALIRVTFLFLASCVFYMAWRPEYIFLILGSTVLDYVAGHQIHTSESSRGKKAWLTASLCGNLGLLFTFKYYNYFAVELTETFAFIGLPIELSMLEMALPVGISFYTFQTLSYTIDIFRGRLEPAKNFFEFACFVTYFPQLVAGPIVRATELLPQLTVPPRLTRDGASRGVFLILLGLIKKVAIADYLAVNLVDRVFDNPDLYSSAEVVLGLYAFTMQLYCDFSGYTDVARGSAMLFGFELPRNFDRPYAATNPAEFWRKWHMTLSRWLRDYLYFPLGGSRCHPVRAYFNLGVTMFLVGIWHGWWANFEVFFWYALLQTGAMVGHRFVHRMTKRDRDAIDPIPTRVFKIFLALQFVVFSRILFRAESMDNAVEVSARIKSCIAPLYQMPSDAMTTIELCTLSTTQLSTTLWLMLLGTFALHYTPKRLYSTLESSFIRLPAIVQGVVALAVGAILSLVASSEAVPFIYFQF